jgi:hypothetical protein
MILIILIYKYPRLNFKHFGFFTSDQTLIPTETIEIL